ncbi:hypothetical protein ACHAPT_010504 [Fusarium lateritium]
MASIPPQNAKQSPASGHENGLAKPSNWVPVTDAPAYTPRKLRVICIGAGFSSLMMAYHWKHHLKMGDFVDLTIYEKNSDVGGTWLENRYPGVACDVPAHIYTFPFEPNPDWSAFYAPGPEIWEYIKRTTAKYNLDERVQLNSKVISTIWDDDAGKWRVKVEQNGNIIDDEAEILVNGSGILNNWQWPDIKGLHCFRGPLLHSANWDTSVDWAGKRVAIIGNGSSAIQILPQMQAKAGKIVNYVRTPTWIASAFSSNLTPEGRNFQYSEDQKREFRDNPQHLHQVRKALEHSFNHGFYTFVRDTPHQKAAAKACKENMEEKLNHDPGLCKKLIPEWDVGCRRLTPGEGYLEALQKPNVSIEFGGIDSITEVGVKSVDGREDEFDIIICATGFNVSFVPNWTMTGKDNTSLADQWREDPEAYFGICAPNMPNYFIFNGPNCPVGHGNLLAVMEWTTEYILKWCRKIASEGIKSVTIRDDAASDYNVYSQEFLKRTVWTSGCRSWYKSGTQGKVTAMYAGSVLHYKEILESFRTEDFSFEYSGPNRFSFMGNGFTRHEAKGEDLGFYVYK